MRLPPILVLCIAIIAVACACTRNGSMAVTDKLPSCATLAECRAHDGKSVHVVGVYRIWDPRPDRKPGHAPARQVMVRFGDDADTDGVFLGAWGHEGHERPLDEIAALAGKRVQVTGTFGARMPPHPTDPPEAAAVDGPCVHPVTRVELVSKEAAPISRLVRCFRARRDAHELQSRASRAPHHAPRVTSRRGAARTYPGTRTVNIDKPSSNDGTYHSTTHYDTYGRQIGQTHRTTHRAEGSPRFGSVGDWNRSGI